MQKTLILGRLGQDPDVRQTNSGKTVTNLSVATGQKWKDKQSGEMKESVEWHNCVAFDKQAEIIGKFMKKGSQIYIEGENRTDMYEKDGQKHYPTKVHIRVFEFVGPKQEANGNQKPQVDDLDDEDIPF